jgi:hypothetical protein
VKTMYRARKSKACPGPRFGDVEVNTNERFLLWVEITTEVIPTAVRDLDFSLTPLRPRIRHSGEGRNPGAAVRGNLREKIFPRMSDFVALTKAEITFLVLLATALGSIMASRRGSG